VVGRKDWNKNSRESSGRNDEFREDKPIAILGIPDVVVRKAVHVHLAVAVLVPVSVRDEETCAINHPEHNPPNHDGMRIFRDIEVR